MIRRGRLPARRDLGLARVLYQWNDLDAAEQHGQQSLQLARQMENVDTPAACEMFLALLKLAQGDLAGAAALLAQADQFVRQHNFVVLMPEVAAAQVVTLLHQGNLAEAADLAEKRALPVSQARVHLAQGDPATALVLLEPLRRQAEAKGWENERLKVVILEAIAHHALGEEVKAMQLLGEALALGEPGGFIRIFVDEGEPMRLLILDFRLWIEKRSCAQDPKMIGYVDRLTGCFCATSGCSAIKNQQSKIYND